MKVRRNIELDLDLLERLDNVCEKYNLYRSSLVNMVINSELEHMNEKKTILRTKSTEDKVRIQVNVDEKPYDDILNPKWVRIEEMLEKVITEYENNIPRY